MQYTLPVRLKSSLCENGSSFCKCPHAGRLSWFYPPVRNCSDTVQTSHPDADELFKTIDLEVKSNDKSLLNSYAQYVCQAARELDIKVSKVWVPPRVIEKYTLLKSVHIYKKHFVQYETRTHYKSIQLKHLTGSTANTYLEYIERNLPEGMAMKVTKYKVEALPDYIRPPVQEAVDTTEAVQQTDTS